MNKEKIRIVLSLLKSFIFKSSLCFTLTTAFFTVFGKITNMEKFYKGLAVSEITSIFSFAFLIGASLTVASLVKSNAILRNALKFLLCYGSFALAFFSLSVFKGHIKTMQNPALTILILSFCFVIGYVLVALINCVSCVVCKKIAGVEQEYISIYDKDYNK